MINRALIKERLAMIACSISRLEDLASESRDDFLAPGSDLPAVAESHLRRSLEAIFDIGRHVLAKTGHGALAQEYKSIARGLSQQGIVTPPLSHALVAMAGYRNRLVRFYHQITDEELYNIIRNHLDDLRAFVRVMRAYIDNDNAPH